ncbi:hypothetical protein E0L36_16705 [Streptomyces sp. AJS327]|uniref:nuclear transport factor 2 family protein n=1 Tax=Streptomyces sp. AJS327 TaxID=2545265 RepID=UPI0015DF88F0|nr:nuclear transport factor 2 family protein [Streptomyces sp. AJS327]MBA0052492.1 hypothetical protein [Streptomyces sp. AJS327]QNN81295.1 IonBII [Streptomyces sp.]
MVDEEKRKAIALEYCRLMNSGDLEGVLALFTPDVRFQDPVGTPALLGRDALRTHLSQAIAGRIQETPGTPTASLDGESVALPLSGTMDVPGSSDGTRFAFNMISLLRVNSAGLIYETRVIAGQTDFTVLS